MASRAAHAERSPVVLDLHALRARWNCDLENRWTVGRIVDDCRRHHEAACRRAAAENLSPGDFVAAVDFRRLSRTEKPVCPAGRDEHQVLGRDTLEQTIDRGLLVLPAPRRRGHQVRVHRQRERSRAAVVRECSQHPGEIGDARSPAPELLRHSRSEDLAGFQLRVVLCNESIGLVVLGHASREAASKLIGKIRPFARWELVHSTLLLRVSSLPEVHRRDQILHPESVRCDNGDL